jgi:hypothetical protein
MQIAFLSPLALDDARFASLANVPIERICRIGNG